MTKDKIINEAKNQCVHMLVGIQATWAVNLHVHFSIASFTGIIIGIIVEVFQYFFVDNRELKLADRILDLSFWFASSFIFMLMYFVR